VLWVWTETGVSPCGGGPGSPAYGVGACVPPPPRCALLCACVVGGALVGGLCGCGEACGYSCVVAAHFVSEGGGAAGLCSGPA
jgi:hypothetical protein